MQHINVSAIVCMQYVNVMDSLMFKVWRERGKKTKRDVLWKILTYEKRFSSAFPFSVLKRLSWFSGRGVGLAERCHLPSPNTEQNLDHGHCQPRLSQIRKYHPPPSCLCCGFSPPWQGHCYFSLEGGAMYLGEVGGALPCLGDLSQSRDTIPGILTTENAIWSERRVW